MKIPKMMIAALCVGSVITKVIANDDFGIESASPVAIANPVNPQPGMQFSGYKTKKNYWNNEWLQGSIAELIKAPAIRTIVDKSECYTLKTLGDTDANAGLWTGFLKCKRTGVYTFTITADSRTGYSLRVNGRLILPAASKQTSVDVALKTGWNKVEFASHFSTNPLRQKPINIVYKPKESLSDARPLTPAMMFHDRKVEEAW